MKMKQDPVCASDRAALLELLGRDDCSTGVCAGAGACAPATDVYYVDYRGAASVVACQAAAVRGRMAPAGRTLSATSPTRLVPRRSGPTSSSAAARRLTARSRSRRPRRKRSSGTRLHADAVAGGDGVAGSRSAGHGNVRRARAEWLGGNGKPARWRLVQQRGGHGRPDRSQQPYR